MDILYHFVKLAIYQWYIVKIIDVMVFTISSVGTIHKRSSRLAIWQLRRSDWLEHILIGSLSISAALKMLRLVLSVTEREEQSRSAVA